MMQPHFTAYPFGVRILDKNITVRSVASEKFQNRFPIIRVERIPNHAKFICGGGQLHRRSPDCSDVMVKQKLRVGFAGAVLFVWECDQRLRLFPWAL